MPNENQKSYHEMNAQELRAGINAVLTSDSAPLNPSAGTLTPEELRVNAILRKRTDQMTADDRAFLAAGIAEWENGRNL